MSPSRFLLCDYWCDFCPCGVKFLFFCLVSIAITHLLPDTCFVTAGATPSPLCLKVQFLFLWALLHAACVLPGSRFVTTGVTCLHMTWNFSFVSSIAVTCLLPGSCFVTTGVTCLHVTWNFSFVSSIAVTCLLPGSCFVTTGATPLLCAWKSSFLSCKHCCMQLVFFQVLALWLLEWLVSLMLESPVSV